VFPTSRTISRFNDFSRANRFTSACGTGIYSDALLGHGSGGNAFTCEPVHNLVSRLVLDDERGAAVAVRGRRAADEGQSEFLASSDNWFRPTMVRTGPDGTLWIADMYRAVIEHPEWIPDEYRRKLDLYAGTDRGRIYRVVPVGAGPAAAGGLRAWFSDRWDRLPLVEVVERLESPNGWWRDWAQRVLAHRQAELVGDPLALERLESVACRAPAAQRVQALAALAAAQPAPDAAGIHPAMPAALAAREPQVRRIAVELLEPALRAGNPDAIPLLASLADDQAECVRLQLLLSLGETRGVEGAGLLGRLLSRYGDSALLCDAGLTSVTPATIGPVLQHVLRADRRDHTDRLISRLMAQAAAMGRHDLLVEPLVALLRSVRGDVAAATLAHVGETLRYVLRGPAAGALRGHPEVGRELASAAQACAGIARRLDAAPDRRAAALAVLAAAGPADTDLAEIAALVAPQTPPEVQLAAVRLLAGHGPPAVVRGLLGRLETCAPTVRSELLGGLLQREASTRLLLDAVEAGDLAASALDAEHRDRLANHRDPAIAAAARDLFSRGQASDRRAIVDDYRDRLTGLTADPGAGRAVFERRCGVCHRLQGLGREVGADLAALKDRSTAALLTAILDPNRAVESKYLTCTVVTTDGQAFSGMLKGESGSGLTLVAGDGKEATISRSDIEEFVVSSRSLMPEGLEKDLTPQELADVIAFVQAAGVAWKRFAGNAPAPVVAGADGTITLPAEAAEIYGTSLVFEKKHANLGFWNSADDYARWSFDVPRTGRWAVELDFACDDATAGGLIRFSTGTRMLTGRVPGTGDWGTYRTWKVGAIDLRSGRGELIVTAAEHAGPALVDLRAIRLIPH
jgi:putative heme-binding domain-containing protein